MKKWWRHTKTFPNKNPNKNTQVEIFVKVKLKRITNFKQSLLKGGNISLNNLHSIAFKISILNTVCGLYIYYVIAGNDCGLRV